jgi:hypothetical protein
MASDGFSESRTRTYRMPDVNSLRTAYVNVRNDSLE